MSHTITVEIEAESANHAESLLHELRKQVDDAQRYGVDVSVRRVEQESEHKEGFDESG